MFRVTSYQSAFRILLVSLAFVATAAVAQDSQPEKSTDTPAKDTAGAAQAQPGAPSVDPLKRPLDAKKKKQQMKDYSKEIKGSYKKWLDEDVVYIITDEERAAFKQLSNDEERDNFIEAFWQRRDPTPDTEENEYKEEHYQRIAYANEHFAAGVPGWSTDRGRMYIMYGKADEIESHPSGGTYERPMEEGGGETSTFPFETWRYRYLEGIGQEVIIEFVDTCMCGEYHMTMDRSEKDALLYTPNAGLTFWEQMGMSNKASRFTGNGIERLGAGPESSMLQTKEFDRLEQFAKLQAAPPVKFTDLEEIVNSKVILNPMPFDVRSDFVKVTSDTVLVPVTIQMKNRDITFVNKDGVQRGTVNIFGRVYTLTGQDRSDLRRHGAGRRSCRASAAHRRELLRLLEGSAAASRPLQTRHRSERCERRPQRRMEPQHRRSGILRRQACDFVSDRCRPDGTGSDQGDRHRQLRHRHHQSPAPRGSRRRQAGSLQER